MSGFALPEGWDERPEIEINLPGFPALGRVFPPRISALPALSATIKENQMHCVQLLTLEKSPGLAKLAALELLPYEPHCYRRMRHLYSL